MKRIDGTRYLRNTTSDPGLHDPYDPMSPPSSRSLDPDAAFVGLGGVSAAADEKVLQHPPYSPEGNCPFVVGDRIAEPHNMTWGVILQVSDDGLRVVARFFPPAGEPVQREVAVSELLSPKFPDGRPAPPWRIIGCDAPARATAVRPFAGAVPAPTTGWAPWVGPGPARVPPAGPATAGPWRSSQLFSTEPFGSTYPARGAAARVARPVASGDFAVALLQGPRGETVGDPQDIPQDPSNPKTNANVAATFCAQLQPGDHFAVLNRGTGSSQKYVVVSDLDGQNIAKPVGKPKRYGTVQLRRNGSGAPVEHVELPDYPNVYGVRPPGSWVANPDADGDDQVFCCFDVHPLVQLRRQGHAAGVLVSARSSREAVDRAMPLFDACGLASPSDISLVASLPLEQPIPPDEII